MKRSTYFLLLAASLALFGSCKKFVEEEMVSQLNYDYYETDQGLEDLVRSAYTNTRYKFENEQAYALWNFGVDEFIIGDQFNYNYYNLYDARLNSNDGLLDGLWSACYVAINRCNLGIKYIPGYSNSASRFLATQAQKNQRLGELYFLRAYYYFQLVQQFGALPLVTDPSEGARSDFPRSPVARIYEQIISDLRFASENLAPTTSDQGRATRGAANHFLAKAYLTRGSAVTEARGQKPTDMDSAAYYAELVINSGTYQLEQDYMNLWRGVYPKGYPQVQAPALGTNGTPPYNTNFASGIAAGDYAEFQAAQASKEIIFAAQFSNNSSLNSSSGNRTHLFFVMQYDAGIPGLTRNADNFNMRPYRRLMPSDYTIDLFDRRNDSRFYKSFRTAYYRNVQSDNGIPRFTAADAPNPSLVGKPRYGLGDTAALFIVNTPATALTAAELSNTTRFRYVTFPRWYRDASGNLRRGTDSSKYLTLVKHLDPVRILPGFNEERGIRNGTLARFAETYLIAAEAWGRKGDFGKALQYINVIRKRAAYRQNEFKNPAFWMFDGGAQNDLSETYTGKLEATAALWSGASTEPFPPSVTSAQDRFIHFMVNERTRELCGEFLRWEDLARTETFFVRTKQYNRDAVNLQQHHRLRPIPQLVIDATTIDGRAMNAAEKVNYQNPGY